MAKRKQNGSSETAAAKRVAEVAVIETETDVAEIEAADTADADTADAELAAAEKKARKAEKKARKAEKKARKGNGAPVPLDEKPTDLAAAHPPGPPRLQKKLKPKFYAREMAHLQIELAKLQSWIKATGQKIVVIFEGRDAAGKGGIIKRITEPLNPRIVRVVALGTPTERERSQWYFQRYVAHLPSAGEMVLFDRSWYNRAGVERVMGFATDDQVREFLYSVPQFERMLVRSGITLIKYWFSVSPEVQEKRFQKRSAHPTKRWKISEMDIESRLRWDEYSQAKDEMFSYTDIKQAPWHVVESDDKERARLNCISHLLEVLPYQDHIRPPLELPPRPQRETYLRPPYEEQNIVPRHY